MTSQPAKELPYFFCGLSKIDHVYIGQAGSMFCPQDRSGSQESPVSSSKFLEDGQSRYKGLASVKKKDFALDSHSSSENHL